MFSGFGAVIDGTRSVMSRPKPVEAAVLGRVVGDEPHGGDAEVDQDLGADAVLAAVDRQARSSLASTVSWPSSWSS